MEKTKLELLKDQVSATDSLDDYISVRKVLELIDKLLEEDSKSTK